MKTSTVQELAEELGEDKEDLIEDIRSNILLDVQRLTASKCFSIIEKGYYKNIEYEPPSLDWAKRFVSFCRKKKFEGKELDSPVTEVVTNAVTESFLKFYNNKSENVSEIIAKDLASNEAFVDSIVEAIHEANIVKGSKFISASIIRSQIKSIIISSLNSTQVQAVAQQVTTMTSAIVAKVAASSVGPLIMKQLMLYSKVVIAKILSSAAFKTMVVAAVKKFALAAIIAAVTHVLWGLLGAKVAAALGSIIVPIFAIGILGWVVYEIANMPEKLADKLSYEVSRKIDGEFAKINKDVAINIYESIGSNFGSFAASLIADNEFVNALNSTIDNIEDDIN